MKVKINGKTIPLTQNVELDTSHHYIRPWKSYLDTEDIIKTLKLKELSEAKILINNLNKFPNNYFAHLMKALIFLQKENPSEAKRELLSILNIYPEEVSFDGFDSSKEIDTKVSEKTLQILDHFYEIESFKEIIDLVAIYFERNFNTEITKELTYRYNVNLSALEFDRKVSSPNYAIKYPQVWFNFIAQRKNYEAAERYLKLSLKLYPQEIKNSPFIFINYFPAREEIRELIFPLAIEPVLQTNGVLGEYRKIMLMENNIIKKWIQKKSNKEYPPYFKVKRDFFRETLKKGQAGELSFYHLFELGDESIGYFKWLK